MRKFALITALFASVFSANSQTISEVLQQQLENSSKNDLISVQVIFRDQADMRGLHQKFIEERVPLARRQQEVIKELKRVSDPGQRLLREYIESENQKKPGSCIIEQSYYISNLMVVRATPEFIEKLAKHDAVELLEWNERLKVHQIAPVESGAPKRMANGAEPGLKAINAPFLWKLGYTGRGTINYTVDTGVWPNHPALRKQYRGTYFPQAWTWQPYDQPEPRDKNNSHGTHVSGIVCGLDTLTRDTIGVAFNATFIAADPIVEDLTKIKPVSELIGTFQFALNPDGDESTPDAPDVITNSWGIADTFLSELCSGFIIQGLFDALDAAGIAVEFSAGNSGPGESTISMPQYVSLDTLNIFTVGAVNSLDSVITSFSSRGPSQCTNADPRLRIKPEVSAPGYQVRSSVKQNGYTYYSGTSMSGPHCAGAVLLLKEAYPMASGREILNALYQSAYDLGVEGEDNIYGKGLIDLKAAYEFLQQSYTPVPPNQSPVDLVLENILAPSLTCPGLYNVKAVMLNAGKEAAGTGTIVLRRNLMEVASAAWNTVLLPGERDTVDFGPVNLPSGTNELFATYYTADTSLVELETVNNNRTIKVIVPAIRDIPFVEGFENNDVTGNDFMVINPDYNTTWDTVATQGLQNSRYSARMNFVGYYASEKQYDDLITPILAVPAGTSELNLRFDYAIRRRNGYIDSLRISVSRDCGQTWDDPIFHEASNQMYTADTNWTLFRPLRAEHWRTQRIPLNQYTDADGIRIRFQAVNGSGSALYLDNISIYTTHDPVGIQPIPQAEWNIYPNPASEIATIRYDSRISPNSEWFISDINGRILKKGMLQPRVDIELESLPASLYLVQIQTRDGRYVKKLVKS